MAKYTGPVCRICRREKTKLFLKGSRCLTKKCAFTRRGYPPGQHGNGRSKISDYGLRLREKQKLRRTYNLVEKQFEAYFEAASSEKGVTGDNLLILLERRFDNVIFRAGFATSRNQARQFVRHGMFMINGKNANIPSIQIKADDIIKVVTKKVNLKSLKEALETGSKLEIPGWVQSDPNKREIKILRKPIKDDIQLGFQLNEQFIVEFYSK